MRKWRDDHAGDMDPRRPSNSHLLRKSIGRYEPSSPISRSVRNTTILLLLLRQILRRLRHPVLKRSRPQSRPSDWCLRLNRPAASAASASFSASACSSVQMASVPRLRRHNISPIHRRNEPARCGLCFHHVLELAPLGRFNIVPIFLLDDLSTLKDAHDIGRLDLGEVVRDDDCRLARAPALDSFGTSLHKMIEAAHV